MVSAQAWSHELPNASDSWQTILENPNVAVVSEGVVLSHAYSQELYSVFSLCTDADQDVVRLQARTATYCLKDSAYPGRPRQAPPSTCHHVEVTPSAPLTMTKTVCILWSARHRDGSRSCLLTRQEKTTLQTTVEVPVAELVYESGKGSRRGRKVGSVLFRKEFTIPVCQQ